MFPRITRQTERRLRRLAGGFAAYRRRQRDLERLHDMPDSLLDDIGLTRSQIRSTRSRGLF